MVCVCVYSCLLLVDCSVRCSGCAHCLSAVSAPGSPLGPDQCCTHRPTSEADGRGSSQSITYQGMVVPTSLSQILTICTSLSHCVLLCDWTPCISSFRRVLQFRCTSYKKKLLFHPISYWKRNRITVLL